MDQVRLNLRLVSRTFNNMVISSPDSILIKNRDSVIAPRTRSMCISNRGDALAGFRQLLAQPGAASRISTLVMPLSFSGKGQDPVEFNLLCNSSPSLPSIRRLTLGFPSSAGSWSVASLWSRINNAFPLLTCLVLGTGLHSSSEATNVTFKKLEILDADSMRNAFSLRFPLLRHAVINIVTNRELESLEHSKHLESMLIHYIHGISRGIDWRGFEQLRLLGVPLLGMDRIGSFTPNHPLELLYVYMDSQKHHRSDDIVRMVQKTTICLPTVKQIYVDINNLSQPQRLLLERELQGTKLASMGLHTRSLCAWRYQLVIERIPKEDQVDSEMEMVTRSGVLRSTWSRLTRSGSRRPLM